MVSIRVHSGVAVQSWLQSSGARAEQRAVPRTAHPRPSRPDPHAGLCAARCYHEKFYINSLSCLIITRHFIIDAHRIQAEKYFSHFLTSSAAFSANPSEFVPADTEALVSSALAYNESIRK